MVGSCCAASCAPAEAPSAVTRSSRVGCCPTASTTGAEVPTIAAMSATHALRYAARSAMLRTGGRAK